MKTNERHRLVPPMVSTAEATVKKKKMNKTVPVSCAIG